MACYLMTFDTYWAAAARRWAWLAVVAGVFVGLALMLYAGSSDHYTTTAVATSKQGEEKSFDLASVSGLAALAGGGQRPTFEQLTFLISSESNIRQLLPVLQSRSPDLAAYLLSRGFPQRLKQGMENAARALFGKVAVVENRDDELIDSIRARLKISKTPEGYLRVDFTAVPATGQLDLVRGLLAGADTTIRNREAIDYRGRVTEYQSLVDRQQRPTDRLILISLMSREYATYVAAQSGEHFSYAFVEPPVAPRRIYTTSLLTLIAAALLAAVACYLAVIFVTQWRSEV